MVFPYSKSALTQKNDLNEKTIEPFSYLNGIVLDIFSEQFMVDSGINDEQKDFTQLKRASLETFCESKESEFTISKATDSVSDPKHLTASMLCFDSVYSQTGFNKEL